MSDNKIRFIDMDGGTLFTIPDGGSVVITHPSGEQYYMKCRYVDETHFKVEDATHPARYFAELTARSNAAVAPDPAPEVYEGYRIVARKPAGDLVIVHGHAPHARLPWATWQASGGAPTDYSMGIYRAERWEALTDMNTRAEAARQGIPYTAKRTSGKQIEFRGPDFRPAFSIADGSNIVVTCDDGEQVIRQCVYINECHMYVGFAVYHADEFASRMAQDGSTYVPETKPEFASGYHILHKMPAGDKVFAMGYSAGAAQPWATWQGVKGRAGYDSGHFYSLRDDAQADLVGRTCAHREGRPYEAYQPPKQQPKSKDRENF